MARVPKQRAQTLVITWGNEERAIANALIREKLKEDGELQGAPLVQPLRFNVILTGCSKKPLLTNDQLGDKIRFGITDKMLDIEKDQYLTIRSIESQHNCLILEKENGQSVVWQPPKNLNDRIPIEVYKPEKGKLWLGIFALDSNPQSFRLIKS